MSSVSQDVLASFSNAIVGVAGYYVTGEGTQHVIVGTSDGTVTEVYWKSGQGVHQDVLANFASEIVGVGGYYAADDGTQHAIVGTSDGNLAEVYWKSDHGL